MHRRTFTRSLVAVSLATTLVAAGGCTDNPQGPAAGPNDGKALEKITYLTSFGAFGRDAYAYVAKEKGYFAEAGFDVTIEPGSGSGENLKQVVAGKAQFAAVDMTGALLAAGAKEPLKGFTAVAAVQQRTMAAIITLDSKNISVPKDLEGKTLTDADGSVVKSLFPTYAQLAKIDPDKVTWVQGRADQLIKTLADNKTDGIGQFVVGKPTVETVAQGRRAVALSYGDYLQDLYGNVLVTSSGYAADNPEKATKFATALLRGLQDAIGDPSAAGDVLKRNVPATPSAAAAAAELKLMAPFVRSEAAGVPVGALDSSRVARNIAVLQSSGQVAAGLVPDDVISFDLLPKM